SFVRATEKDLYLADIVVGDGEIRIDGNRAFESSQSLIQVLSQPFQHVTVKVGSQRVVGFDGQRLTDDAIERLKMFLARTTVPSRPPFDQHHVSQPVQSRKMIGAKSQCFVELLACALHALAHRRLVY